MIAGKRAPSLSPPRVPDKHLEIFRSSEYLRAAKAVGSFIEFWGFKRIHGMIWFVLYTSPRPLSQQEIVAITQFSKASISLALKEMLGWGVIYLQPVHKGKERFYSAETHLGKMVRNVLERREKIMLEEALGSFSHLLSELRKHPPKELFIIRRVETLYQLTRAAHIAVDEFLKRSRVVIHPLRSFFLRDLR
jgi:DNA-binding transcriptional regulator GbsR (MarR family)